jgi:hypothetical protein
MRKAPNSLPAGAGRHPIPNKFQSSKTEIPNEFNWVIGNWDLFGACNLGFGI